jgi:hypothetical protein
MCSSKVSLTKILFQVRTSKNSQMENSNQLIEMKKSTSHASAEAQGNVVRAICLSKVNPHF